MAKKFIPVQEGQEQHDAQQDYQNAAQYGAVLVGERYLFHKGFTQVKYLPLEEIVWCYMRQEDSNITLCCGKGTLPTYFLVAVTASKVCMKVAVERSQDVKAALQAIAKRNPQVAIGYYDAQPHKNNLCAASGAELKET